MVHRIHLINPVNIFSESINDRTATLTTTSEDGLNHRIYKLIFHVTITLSDVIDIKYKQAFSIYPNPVYSNSTLYVELQNTDANDNELKLTDLSGKLISSATIIGSKFAFTLTGQEKGLYLLSIRNSIGITFKKLIII